LSEGQENYLDKLIPYYVDQWIKLF
jgi:hypothetical protein